MSFARSNLAIAVLLALTALAVPARAVPVSERSFERVFPVAGQVTLDVVTNSGAVAIRAGEPGSVTVRGTVKRNVSWRGAQVTDEQIASLRAKPPVRADGSTIRVERLTDDALWRATSIDYEIVVPAETRIRVVTASGRMSVAGTRGEVAIETGSGAVSVDVSDGNVDLRSESGSLRAIGSMKSLAMRTQSGSIVVDAASVGSVETTSGSGSVTVRGGRGAVYAKTGSGRISVEGIPSEDWTLRSRSGSVSLRVPASHGFDFGAMSRSGDVHTEFPVADTAPRTKHRVEGKVNGGGPKISVQTQSSQITIRP